MPDLFANNIKSLARNILLTNYINSLLGKCGIIYTSFKDKNKENNINILDNNTNIVWD